MRTEAASMTEHEVRMNPFWFATKVAGVALMTFGGAILIAKKIAPKPSDVIAGSIHLKKSADEFRKGVSTIFFGSSESEGEQKAKERKEAARIPID